MARPWASIWFAALTLIGLAAACPSGAAASKVARTACVHHTHAKGCSNGKLDKHTTRAAAASDSSCPNATLRPKASNIALVNAAILCLINSARMQAGVAPLRANAHLASAASRHSADMASSGYFDHTSPGGNTVGARIAASGYLKPGRAATLAENIAWIATAASTPAAMVSEWLGSPDHRANMLDPSFRDTGIGTALARPSAATSGAAGVDVTEDFGAIG